MSRVAMSSLIALTSTTLALTLALALAPALTIALALALAPAPAFADDDGPAGPVPDVAASAVGPSADAWLRIGLERYERGNLVGAIEAFERGYQRESRPTFLFALGQAHRKRGACDRARAMFDAFLATRPSQAQADAALQQRETCAPPAPDEPPPAAPAVAPSPPPAPAVVVIEHRTRTTPWYRDPIAIGAGTTTVALLGTSAALWLAAERAADGAADADTYDRHAILRERAESRQLQASIALGAAAVTTAVTVWRIARDRTEHHTQQRERGAALTPVIGAGGIGVALGGRF